VELDRKVLADPAVNDAVGFAVMVAQGKAALDKTSAAKLGIWD